MVEEGSKKPCNKRKSESIPSGKVIDFSWFRPCCSQFNVPLRNLPRSERGTVQGRDPFFVMCLHQGTRLSYMISEILVNTTKYFVR